MDTPDLAAMVPTLMVAHPAHAWTLSSGTVPGEDLVLEMHPVAAPERVATIHVDVGAEVYRLAFAGHCGHDFAYVDPDRADVLRERIDLAAAASAGPTRVVLDSAAGVTIKSRLILDPDGPDQQEAEVVSWPLRYVAAGLRRRRITRQVRDFAGLTSP